MYLQIWDWKMLGFFFFQIKFRWSRNSTQNRVLRLPGSRWVVGWESNTFYLRYGTNFHPKIIIYPVTNGYCKIFINLSAYKKFEFLIQSSILLLNFILSLARSLGMWLQSKLKSNHIWITFPHECNNFGRLINVRQRLSHRMRTFPGEMRRTAVVRWSHFFTGLLERMPARITGLGHSLVSCLTEGVLPFYLSKSHLQNTIPVYLWLWEIATGEGPTLVPCSN